MGTKTAPTGTIKSSQLELRNCTSQIQSVTESIASCINSFNNDVEFPKIMFFFPLVLHFALDPLWPFSANKSLKLSIAPNEFYLWRENKPLQPDNYGHFINFIAHFYRQLIKVIAIT